MLKNAKVRIKLLLGFSIILSMMLLNIITNFYNLVVMEHATEKVANEVIPLNQMVEEIGTELANEEAGVRGYIASDGDTRFLESYDSSSKNIDLLMKELKKYYSQYPSLAITIENEVKPNITTIHNYFDSQIDLTKSGEVQVARDRLGDGRIFMDVYRHVHNKLREQINQVSLEARTNSMAAGIQAKWNMVIILLISVGVSFIITAFLSRAIAGGLYHCVTSLQMIAEGNLATQPLKIKTKDEIGELGVAVNTMLENIRNIVFAVSETSRQVAASSEELSASAEESAMAANQVAINITEVSQGIENQARASEVIFTTVEQMTAGVQETATKVSDIANIADHTSQAVEGGAQAIKKAVDQMTAINQSTQAVGQAVAKLNNNSLEIGQIVDTISTIAEQTNLLALNAAIEAARAGEQGRGFAVVAEEVRHLAEQSQEATKRIAQLIGQIQDDTRAAVSAMNTGTEEVERGIKVVNTAGQAFSQIRQQVNAVSSEMANTSATLQQLDASSQQIIAAIKEIDRISKEVAGMAQNVSATTQEQSASTEEIASSSDNLAKMTQELQAVINKFNLEHL